MIGAWLEESEENSVFGKKSLISLEALCGNVL